MSIVMDLKNGFDFTDEMLEFLKRHAIHSSDEHGNNIRYEPDAKHICCYWCPAWFYIDKNESDEIYPIITDSDSYDQK